MIQEDILGLLPGAGFFGQGSTAEQHMPAQALPGGNVTLSPSGQVGAVNRQSEGAGTYGSKYPLNKIPQTEQGIKEARDATKGEETYLGIPVSLWHQIGVYGALAIIFLVGLVGLLTAAGIQTPVQKLKTPFR